MAVYIEKYEEPARHIEALIGASIVTLDIRPRLLYPLADAGIRTVGELIEWQRRGLTGIRQIGEGASVEVEALLNQAGLLDESMKI